MKRQIMTLAVCLALTANVTWASDNGDVSTQVLTKNMHVAEAVNMVANQIPVSDVNSCPKQSVKTKFKARWAEDREELYCKLGLTPEQKAKAKALDEQKKIDAEPLLAKFHEEKAKLHQLKVAGACSEEINKQKMKVKDAEKTIKAHMEASRKKFEAILDKCQLAKYQAIRKERKEQWEKFHHHHHHHGECGCAKEELNAPEKCPCESK